MLVCTRSFNLGDNEFTEGLTRVCEDHPVLETHGDHFTEDRSGPGAGAGIRARKGDRVITGEDLGLFSERTIEQAARERIREVAKDPANREEEQPPQARRRRDNSPNAEAREIGLRAIDSSEDLNAEDGDRLEHLIRNDHQGIDSRYIAAISDPDYESGFWKRLADPQGAQHSYSPQEAEAVRRLSEIEAERAMSEGTTTAGGFGVPLALDPTIMLSSSGSVSPLRELATTTTITTRNWLGVSSDGITAGFSAEATETTDNAPTLAQPSILAEKAQAFVPFSIEVGQDYASLQQELGNLLADAKTQLESDRFTYGTAGANEPGGILTGGTATTRLDSAGTAALASADVYALQEALGSRFQPNATFLSDIAISNRIWKLVAVGSTSEARLYSDDRAMLIGKPWREMSSLASTVTSGSLPLIYGDIAAGFRIVDRIGLSIDLIPHLMGSNRRPTGQRGLYAFWRCGSGVVIPAALRVLKIK